MCVRLVGPKDGRWWRVFWEGFFCEETSGGVVAARAPMPRPTNSSDHACNQPAATPPKIGERPTPYHGYYSES